MLASKCGDFQVGEGENIPFGPVEFSCEVMKVLTYSKTDKRVQQSEKLLEKKKQKYLTFSSVLNMIVMVCSTASFI